ncbi:MAG TPA: hypothetical protein PLV92_03335, partial [Pirellulaceae bacterium]|nr:hypothetical protein [Pirellulaceae bacterium]
MRLVRALLGAWLLVCLGTFVPHAVAQQAASDQVEKIDLDMVKKIRDEGMQRSKVMETASFLTDVHGPRLTNSPEIRKAGEWTKGKLSEWGLKNARMETWGPFGRGWSMEKFTANMTAPQFAPLIAYPKAWSPSTPTVVKGEPIYLDAATEADLDKYRGKLHRAIVMISGPREVKALFDPPAKRQTDESLLALANSAGTRPFVPTGPGLQGNSGAGPSKDGDGAGKGDAKPGAPAGKDAAAKDSKPSEAAGQPGAKPGDDAARGQRGGR